jgi:hypothetical protein
MDEKTTYEELIKELKDPSDPLFGGSLAYITIEESLAMFIKLMQIKMKKPSELSQSYQTMITVCSMTAEEAHLMIKKDGENFSLLRNAASQSEKDQVVIGIYPRSKALLFNLDTIMTFLEKLYFVEKGSIQYDYLMIRDIIKACYLNLNEILGYEVRKMSESPEKAKFLSEIEEMAQRKSYLENKLSEDEAKGK